jgi:hypothetical protein
VGVAACAACEAPARTPMAMAGPASRPVTAERAGFMDPPWSYLLLTIGYLPMRCEGKPQQIFNQG